MAADRKRRLATGLILMLTICMWLPTGSEASVVAGPVSVGRVTFYNGRHFRFGTCTPLGRPQTAFHNTARNLYVRVFYSRWQGRHTDRNRWYSPDGRFYLQDNPLTYTGRGPRMDCGFLRIAGTRGERLLGRWTYQLVLDGRVAYTSSFTLSAATM